VSDKPCSGHAAHPFGECLACRAIAAETDCEDLQQQLAAECVTQPCGHAAKWLAYRNAVDVRSERYCVFCEIARLRKMCEPIAATPDEAAWWGRVDGGGK
jgi:hypothetical protein